MKNWHKEEYEAVLEDGEVAALLHRLHENQFGQVEIEDTCSTTVQDIAEATDLPEALVAQELLAMRDEARRQNIESAIRELEEPLHRVERPSVDPLMSTLDHMMRRKTIESTLDQLHQQSAKKKMPKQKAGAVPQSKLIQLVEAIILTFLGALMIYFLGLAIWQYNFR